MKRRAVISLLGGAAAWPFAADAQQPTVPVIGYLSSATESVGVHLVPAFRQGLREEGYVEGRNVKILFQWFEGQYDRLPALAADLVGRRVDAIFAIGETIALTTKVATSTIPIVFAFGGDPVAIGLVPNLNRPGGNVTGATNLAKELAVKQLELLHETVRGVTSIGYLVRPDDSPYTPTTIKEVETAARILGVRLIVVNASTPSDIEADFTTLVRQGIGALIVADSGFLSPWSQVVALATRHAVPAIYGIREHVEAGGLMSYGASLFDTVRLAGTYVGRILKGEKPADLPVQQSTKVELVINMKTAKALGITFPLDLLGRADEVIE